MHHPWRYLREHLPEWRVTFGPLPDGMIGATDTERRTITLVPGMMQAQRRAVLDHELIHAECGDDGPQCESRETAVDAQSARRLIPLDALVDAAAWAHCIDELAEDCWVDVDTMQVRIDTLTDAEAAAVARAVARRDWHEEARDDDLWDLTV